MDNQLEKVEGLYARIRSGYYLKNENNKILQFYNDISAYQYLKQYIEENKSDSDIIIYNDDTLEIIINTVNKNLKLDRFVYIDKTLVNIDNLSENIK